MSGRPRGRAGLGGLGLPSLGEKAKKRTGHRHRGPRGSGQRRPGNGSSVTTGQQSLMPSVPATPRTVSRSHVFMGRDYFLTIP